MRATRHDYLHMKEDTHCWTNNGEGLDSEALRFGGHAAVIALSRG